MFLEGIGIGGGGDGEGYSVNTIAVVGVDGVLFVTGWGAVTKIPGPVGDGGLCGGLVGEGDVERGGTRGRSGGECGGCGQGGGVAEVVKVDRLAVAIDPGGDEPGSD